MTRIAGGDSIDTAVKVSRAHWKAISAADGNPAESVVIAQFDGYKDGLSAIPLAKAKKGPLLITEESSLDARVGAEIQRILPAGKTVYIAGGPGAVSSGVERSIRSLGYQTKRHGGADAVGTSLAVAREGIGTPRHVTIASADDWKDPLSAASAVAAADGALILSDGERLSPEAKAWLDGLPPAVTKTTVGGPARRAYPSTDGPVVGKNAVETSAFIADKFMPNPGRVALATTNGFRDGLAGGAYAATIGMPTLLNPADKLERGSGWFAEDHSASTKGVTLFGGTSALSGDVASAVQAAATEKFIPGELVPADEKPGTAKDVAHLAIAPDWALDGKSLSSSGGYSGGMNDAEYAFCKWPSRWSICTKAKGAADLAQYKANREKESGGMWPGSKGNGGKVDAYRHCSWNSVMAFHMGSKTAKGFGDRHEKGPKPPNMSESTAERHHLMDKYNNSWGRYFGQYARDVGMSTNEAVSHTTGWCLLAVNEGTLDYMWY
ncbi:cell wall-binding repeat-containing protein [Streptomyces sp. AV19]|uniref:cell wall-binding repeat-containing protein n=1 Tax=Streptomyces sp. AV19 TaxID=2793068 RepID=UPI0018FEFD76|nr:cell wall-binding repeat-containing protein [Streptomyces sp. AV19]MBH1936669.1 cell wall-binding repeat-containing protein [Streptomyces sp. AV19]MDG4532719.1 cell wall-binding repeat-containing protein [Streptomyces sp. AV19]